MAYILIFLDLAFQDILGLLVYIHIVCDEFDLLDFVAFFLLCLKFDLAILQKERSYQLNTI